MRKIILSFLTLTFIYSSNAQDIDNNPGAYMSAMSKTHSEMDSKYMAYRSAAAHGKRARKVEKLRKQVLESISSTHDKINELPFYKGDNSLRKSNMEYVDFCYKVFTEDYEKIINMEAIVEQSFDEMQAYILLQEKIGEKLKQASEKVNKASKEFAAKYNVTLTDGGKDELGEKLEQASKVSKYYHPVYLIFFKCSYQDNQMTKALNDKKVNEAEQARQAVIKYADEGIATLNAMQSFQGDASLKQACMQALKTFKTIAEKNSPTMIDFILKSENFGKLKKAIDEKDQSERTKEDIDNFNKAVKEYNDGVNKSNEINNIVRTLKTDLYNNWEKAVADFFDTHTPKYK